MQNLSYLKPAACELNDPSNCVLIPRYDHCLSIVNPSSDPYVTAGIPGNTVTPHTHISLSRKQAQVLDFLVKNISRQINYNSIGRALGLTKSAARDAVSALVTKNYISDLATIRDGVFQGFSYKVDGIKCQHFIDAGGVTNPKYSISNYTVTPPPHTVCPGSDQPHTHSSRVDIQITTNNVDLSEPELLYWVEQGLTEKQIKTWLTQFQMHPEDLSQSLRFARFDFVENQKKQDSKGVLIESPIGYFFGVLKNAGRYARPANYRSIIELRAEELKDQQQRDEVARNKIWDTEIETKLKKLLGDPESALYLELLDSVDDFAKNNQFALEIKMRELLKEKYPM